MSEMVERVAHAIFAAQGKPAAWYEKLRPIYEDDARAAIAAMRDLTAAQYEALSATGKMWPELNSETVWKAFIDAALEST